MTGMAGMTGMNRRIVIVSGAPGAGKSTLAGPLAAALGLPLFAKDAIKETLYEVLGDDQPAPLPVSRQMGAASMELLWRLAQDAPACVMEANFKPAHEYSRSKLLELSKDGLLIEVHCFCPPEEAARRYDARGLGPERHRVHTFKSLPAESRAEYPGPLGLGPVIRVDTTRPVDVEHLASLVQAALG
jgi:predicted kinase